MPMLTEEKKFVNVPQMEIDDRMVDVPAQTLSKSRWT